MMGGNSIGEAMDVAIGACAAAQTRDDECLASGVYATGSAPSEVTGLTSLDQPAPVANTSRPIIELVCADITDGGLVADLRARAYDVGLATYGVLLQAHNGRDALRDAYEEALDLVMYLRQAEEEETVALERLCLIELRVNAIRLAMGLRKRIEWRAT
jgi:hypothetical protein